jgi:hypothetical protein
MVKKKNCVRIPKPILDCDGVSILMDRDFYVNMTSHFDKVNEEFPIKDVHNRDDYLLLEFIDEKHATMYNLKYGDQR